MAAAKSAGDGGRLNIVVVDDDPDMLAMVEEGLTFFGHKVTATDRPQDVVPICDKMDVHCIIVDLMMPRVDGLQLCRTLRSTPGLEEVPLVVMSGKSYDTDRVAAIRAGANAYLVKPFGIDELLRVIDRLVVKRIGVQFWGVRGTLPAPSAGNVRFGGNTSCIALSFPTGQMFVLDAGTGIRPLGNQLMKSRKPGTLSGHIFITHPHWDHINALPFFAPLYVPGNEWTICGPTHGDRGIRDMVAAQMDGTFFPITPREFGSLVNYRDLSEGTYTFDGIEVQTVLLMHPGTCLGYRFNYDGRSLCYVTDNEFFPVGSLSRREDYLNRLTEFARGTDAVITDTTYFDDEYKTKVGWGHSSVSEVVRFAHRAQVKRLVLHHHDPGQDDEAIARKHEIACAKLRELGSPVECLAPGELEELVL